MSEAGRKTALSKARIPLFDIAVDELSRWWERSGRPTAGPVFVWNDKPIGSFKKALATAARKAGIRKRVTPYSLRHTFATRSLEAGVSREHVASVMRHTSPRMVEAHYDHADVARVIDPDQFPSWEADE